jgi:hypothetical protein
LNIASKEMNLQMSQIQVWAENFALKQSFNIDEEDL